MVPFEQLPIYTWAERPSKETPHLDYPHPRKGGSALVHCMSSSGARSLKSHPFIGMFARDDLGSLTTARLEEAEALARVVVGGGLLRQSATSPYVPSAAWSASNHALRIRGFSS